MVNAFSENNDRSIDPDRTLGQSVSKLDHILVVDDDPDVCEVIAAALQKIGLDIITVENAEAALAVAADRSPDVVIADWQLPGMDGIELISRLKADDSDIGAVLTTGYGTKETVIEAFSRGRINYYLAKPFKVHELLEIVSAALTERKVKLSRHHFNLRLEKEIQRATQALEDKNLELEKKNEEVERLYQRLVSRQEESERNKRYLEGLLESSLDAIVSVDRDRQVGFFSRGAEALFGYRATDVVGQAFSMLFGSDDDLTRLFDALDREQKVKDFEIEMVDQAGQPLMVVIAGSALRLEESEGWLFVIKDIAERKKLEEELRSSNVVLERLSVTDGLTGLNNYRFFQQKLQEEFQRAERYHTNLSLIMIDLDDFKRVNDSHGHQVGDAVLVHMAEIIVDSIREVDSAARYGGEEFAVILPQTSIDSAVVVAERIQSTLSATPRLERIVSGLKITATLGIAALPDKGIKRKEDLIRFADQALYRGKNIGKDRIVLGSSSGQTPLGGGEFLTQMEKKSIIRRMAERLKGNLDLRSILNQLLDEIARSVHQLEHPPYCSVMLMNEKYGLVTEIERRTDLDRQEDFVFSANRALETRSPHVLGPDQPHGPVASLPLLVKWPDRGEEVVGVVNIGAIPPDIGFLLDLMDQTVLGLVNAKLYHELAESKAQLENRVDNLLTLSLMSMGLQRNAHEYDDFESENRKLLARSLVRIGWSAAAVYRYLPAKKALFAGVDHTLRGENVVADIDLDHRPKDDVLTALLDKVPPAHNPIVFVGERLRFPEDALRLFDQMNLSHSFLFIARIQEDASTPVIAFGSCDRLSENDDEITSMLLLHAAIILENLSLQQTTRDRARRLTLLHRLGLDLAASADPESRVSAIGQVVLELRRVLQATEISIYAYQEQTRSLNLVSYVSDTAEPGHEPATYIHRTDSPIMDQVISKFESTLQTQCLILDEIKDAGALSNRARYKSSSYLGVPLVRDNKVLGVMNITDKVNLSAFGDEDEEFAQITASMIAENMMDLVLMNRFRDRTQQTLDDLIVLMEQSTSARAVTGGAHHTTSNAAIAIAEVLGWSARDIDQFKLDLWRTMLSRFRTADPDHALINQVFDLLDRWTLAVGELSLNGGPIDARQAAPVAENPVFQAADWFSSQMSNPDQTPAAERLMVDLVEQAQNRPECREAFEALCRAGFRGLLTAQGQPVHWSDDDARKTIQRLSAGNASNDPPFPDELAQRFITIIEEERHDL